MSYPWLLTPALAARLSVLAFNFLADELKLIMDEQRSVRGIGL